MNDKEKLTLLINNNKELFDELCVWIDKNIQKKIGIKELVEQSQLTNSQLQELFLNHKKITPMIYIRNLRENKIF